MQTISIVHDRLVPSPLCVAGQCSVVLQACLHNKTHPPCNSSLRSSVFAGVVVWTLLVVGWTVVYQTQRVNWGVGGDYISLVVPYGRLSIGIACVL